ncbi:MAG: hypothetical protein NWE93_06910 [Candidatus Bathyarchaeota archaeon]|nr:hypothetical protein [Candidatus Bathyarchaeota archaeon]
MKTKIKDVFRGWLPQQPSNFQRLRQHSTPIVIGLAVTALTVSLFLVSTNFIAGYTSVNPPPIAPVANDTVSQSTIAPQATTEPQNNTLLTKEEALAIAVPIIEQYAKDNNRIITNITISDSIKMLTDFSGLRGGASFDQIISWEASPSDMRSFPAWTVVASFQWENPSTNIGSKDLTAQSWIYGFDVSIWADTGQIASSGPNGII